MQPCAGREIKKREKVENIIFQEIKVPGNIPVIQYYNEEKRYWILKRSSIHLHFRLSTRHRNRQILMLYIIMRKNTTCVPTFASNSHAWCIWFKVWENLFIFLGCPRISWLITLQWNLCGENPSNSGLRSFRFGILIIVTFSAIFRLNPD